MVVKSKRGRRRYTAFEVPPGTGRGDLESAVSGIASAKVVTVDGGYAVIRSSPEDRGVLEERVSGAVGGASFDCSGTLKALRGRHPQLEAPAKRRRRRGRSQTLYSSPYNQGASEN